MEYSHSPMATELRGQLGGISKNPFHPFPHRKQEPGMGIAGHDKPSILNQFTGVTTQTTGAYTIRRKKARKEDTPRNETQEGWATCLKVMTEYDQNLIRGWKEEVDGLLIFAGLFSAAVTAFCIESYQWLQAEPTDASTQLLAQISMQLSAMNLNSTSQVLPISPPASPFQPSTLSVRVNTFWFFSLAISLTTALFGTLVKQWLREYMNLGSASVRTKVRIRQQRHNSLIKWGVPQIVSLLPILLQMAVVLFLVGIIDLLWSLNHAVAGAVMVFTGLSMSLFFLVSGLSLLYEDCPYKSPLVGELGFIKEIYNQFRRRRNSASTSPLIPSVVAHTWYDQNPMGDNLDLPAPPTLSLDKQALAWTQRVVIDPELVQPILPCLSDLGREAAFTCVAQECNISTELLLRAVRGLQAFPRHNLESNNVAVREHLILILLNTLKDTAAPTGDFEISRADLLGLVSYLLHMHSPPTASFTARLLKCLLPAMQEIDMRPEHAYRLAHFLLQIAENAEEGTFSLADIGYIVSWALYLYRALGSPSKGAFTSWTIPGQQTFECASGAAFYALNSCPFSANREYVYEQYCKLLQATHTFLEHTTLVEPTVDWFECMHIVACISDGARVLLPVGLVRDIVENLSFLHRVRWANCWALDASGEKGADGSNKITYDSNGSQVYVLPTFMYDSSSE